MPKVTIAGIIFVHTALILYTLFITCMMIGTTRTYFTFHGIVGYIGLLLMVVDAFLLWKYKFRYGADILISKSLNSFSKIAYIWWIIAFITGVLVTIYR
jgi:hypothetical protein